ncbi:MAG: hypothetical protein E7301_12470 [Butyrivibrio sp.]|nr:hypothetical protein [Butyrivibrio sp.]
MPKLNFDNVTEEDLNQFKRLTFIDLKNKAHGLGWFDDDGFLESIWEGFQRDFNSGTLETDSPEAIIIKNILNNDLTNYTWKATFKYEISKYACTYAYNGSEIKDYYAENYKVAYRDENYKYGPIVEVDEKQLQKDRQNNKDNWLSSRKEVWKRPEIKDLISDLYDCAFDKNDAFQERFAKNLDYTTDKNFYLNSTKNAEKFEEQVKYLRQELDRIPRHLRSDKHTNTLKKIDSYLNITIKDEKDKISQKEHEEWLKTPEGMKYTWVENTVSKGYLMDFRPLLRKIYDACADAPEGSDLYNVKKMFEEGKSPDPEYKDISVDDYFYYVAKSMLEKARDTFQDIDNEKVQDALSAIEMFLSENKNLDELAQKEKDEIPFFRTYYKIGPFDQYQIGRLASALKADGNSKGKKDSKEFNELITSMELFSKSVSGPLASLAGRLFSEALIDMKDKATAYIESEKKNNPEDYIENKNISIATVAIDKADPAKAINYRQELAADMYKNLKNATKKWYKFQFINTSEFDQLLKALKTYSEISVTDEGYEKAAEELKKKAKKYIEEKGGMLKEGVRSESEARREIALLALSTVDPEEAQKIVEIANKSKKRKHKIELDALIEKTGIGFSKDSKYTKFVADKVNVSESKVKTMEDVKLQRPAL